jgi:predicted dehydrogenase
LTALEEVGIGVVGYGAMGRAHCYGYTLAPRIRKLPCLPRLRIISGRNAAAVAAVADAFDVERVSTDWRAVIEARDVDIVHVCTPPGTHPEIVGAAAQAGKAVVCEKPLAADYAGALAAARAVQRAGVPSLIGFNYRRLPALALMRQMLDEGRLGTLRMFRAVWLSDEFLDPEIPFDWRFERRMGSSTIADLGAHLLDLAGWLAGEIVAVCAQSSTFTTQRRTADGAAEQTVDVDEASSALVRFAGGATGTFEVAKIAPGRPCDFVVELNGSRGTIRFDYARLNELWYSDGEDPPELYGVRRIRAERPEHPETLGWWPVGQGIGYGASFVNQASHLLHGWAERAWAPDLNVGLSVQAVCEAIELAAAQQRWVSISEIIAGQVS